MIKIKRIKKENSNDINIPNQPFPLFGRMVPSFDGKLWSYTTILLEQDKISEMVFPDENYDYDEMAENSFFVGAYDENNQCIGLAIYQRSWNKYLYLYDLKVDQKNRHKGIGQMLIEEGKKISKENGYIGIYTQGQDNNLAACMFYIKNGFQIGGLDTMVYTGTKQEGKRDIIFYLKN